MDLPQEGKTSSFPARGLLTALVIVVTAVCFYLCLPISRFGVHIEYEEGVTLTEDTPEKIVFLLDHTKPEKQEVRFFNPSQEPIKLNYQGVLGPVEEQVIPPRQQLRLRPKYPTALLTVWPAPKQ